MTAKKFEITVPVTDERNVLILREAVGEGKYGDIPFTLSANVSGGGIIVEVKDGADLVFYIVSVEAAVRAIMDHHLVDKEAT